MHLDLGNKGMDSHIKTLCFEKCGELLVKCSIERVHHDTHDDWLIFEVVYKIDSQCGGFRVYGFESHIVGTMCVMCSVYL